MDSLIIDLSNALEKGKFIIYQYEKKYQELNEREESINARAADIADRNSKISSRESAVSEVENIQELKKNAQSLIDESNVRLLKAAEAEKQFNSYVQTETDKINELRKTAKVEADDAQAARGKIESEVQKRVKDVLAKMNIAV